VSSSAQSPRIGLRRTGPIAYVTLGTGARRNALTSMDWVALRDAFVSLSGDDQLAVVVIRGAGSTFSAGSDISEWAGADESEVEQSFARMEQAFQSIEKLPAPAIAVVEGVAAGAGCELALACDLQLAARSAQIGMPIARLGILISPAFTARLLALAGPSVTREALYTGRLLPGAEAAEIGFATRVVDDDRLDAEVDHVVSAIVAQPIVAVRAAKAAVGEFLFRDRRAADHAAVDHPEFARGVRTFLAARSG
jgi:enoyl-CoA hydratase/carnithine racemase